VRWSLISKERASVRRMKHWYTWGKRWLSWHPRCRVGTWGYGSHQQEICQPRKHESSRKRRKLGIYLGTTLSPLSRRLTSLRALELERLDIRRSWSHGRKKSSIGLRPCGSKHTNGRGVYRKPRHLSQHQTFSLAPYLPAWNISDLWEDIFCTSHKSV